MSFFKKIGQTALNTATTIGAKSADLMETGKLKLAKSQLEGKIKDIKTDIGHVMYEAYKNGVEPDSAVLQAKISEINEIEDQIKSINEKLEQDKAKEGAAQPGSISSAQADTASAQSAFCSNCGAGLGGEAKFCTNCGKPVS